MILNFKFSSFDSQSNWYSIFKFSGIAERDLELLLLSVLPNSRFEGLVHAVGGYVRDEILGKDSKDLDAVIDMENGSEDLTKWLHDMFPEQTSRPHQLGKYPIWRLVFKENVNYNGKLYRTEGAEIEVAETMKESFPDKNSRQRETMPGTIEEDVSRRDFTVNMLLKDLSTGEILDLTGTSVDDIKDGILRGHPDVDFEEIITSDPLRMMRLVRFQAKYNWDVPLSILRAIKNNSDRIKIVSSERVRDELIKLMEIGKLRQGIRLMKTLGLLDHVLPEVKDMIGVSHDTTRGHHQEGDVYNHTLLVLQNAPKGVVGQLSALLHDVGKKDTQKFLEDKITFLGHEEVGAEMSEAILRRLGFPKDVITQVKTIVKYHMRPHGLVGDLVTEKALRKFIRDVGDEMVDAILNQAEADRLGNLPVENKIPVLRERIEEVRNSQSPVSKRSILNGKEIMRILDIGPGRKIKDVMDFLIDQSDSYAERGDIFTKEDAERLILEKFSKSSSNSSNCFNLFKISGGHTPPSWFAQCVKFLIRNGVIERMNHQDAREIADISKAVKKSGTWETDAMPYVYHPTTNVGTCKRKIKDVYGKSAIYLSPEKEKILQGFLGGEGLGCKSKYISNLNRERSKSLELSINNVNRINNKENIEDMIDKFKLLLKNMDFNSLIKKSKIFDSSGDEKELPAFLSKDLLIKIINNQSLVGVLEEKIKSDFNDRNYSLLYTLEAPSFRSQYGEDVLKEIIGLVSPLKVNISRDKFSLNLSQTNSVPDSLFKSFCSDSNYILYYCSLLQAKLNEFTDDTELNSLLEIKRLCFSELSDYRKGVVRSNLPDYDEYIDMLEDVINTHYTNTYQYLETDEADEAGEAGEAGEDETDETDETDEDKLKTESYSWYSRFLSSSF